MVWYHRMMKSGTFKVLSACIVISCGSGEQFGKPWLVWFQCVHFGVLCKDDPCMEGRGHTSSPYSVRQAQEVICRRSVLRPRFALLLW